MIFIEKIGFRSLSPLPAGCPAKETWHKMTGGTKRLSWSFNYL